MFERGEQFKVTEEEIKGLLPEKMRDKYDGTMESLYSIVENQVELLQRGASVEDDEPEKENRESRRDAYREIDSDDNPPESGLRIRKKSLFKKTAAPY
jgi:hypothetical protein